MSSQAPSSNPMAGFGPNEWLVDEIYQQYLTDKNSVDPAWWDFFEDYQPADATLPRAERASGNGHPNGSVDVEPAVSPVPAAAPAPAAPAAPATLPSATAAAPAAPVTPAAPATPAAADEVESIPLRGPAARVVDNMETSLAVPTATVVRAVPAKLLIDNRTVINNHLARARGGKVSFTHLIGWAVVQAVKLMPEMNAGFAHVDGKPVLQRPAHVNLGLAIDLTKPDGTRQLLVPSIKARGHDGLRAVLGDLRGRRPPGAAEQADRRRLRGHHDQPDQPGHHRHRPLGAAPDGRPGHDRRRRRDGVPGRVPGRLRRRRSPASRSARS